MLEEYKPKICSPFKKQGKSPGEGSEYSTKDEEAAGGNDSRQGNESNASGWDRPGPPNLHLNLSFGEFDKGPFKKEHQDYLIGLLAVGIQAAPIVLASVLTFRSSTAVSKSLGGSKAYGYPTYLIGSLILSIGAALCSIIVERKTCEHLGKIQKHPRADEKNPMQNMELTFEDEKIAPLLIWLQKDQKVNEQFFGAYAVSPGRKKRILISRKMKVAKAIVSKKGLGGSSETQNEPNQSSQGEKDGETKKVGSMVKFPLDQIYSKALN